MKNCPLTFAKGSPELAARVRLPLDPDWKRYLLGVKYWNANNSNIVIVAQISRGIDWALYIGAAPGAKTEEEAIQHIASYGDKLDETLARFLLPNVQERYRH